MRKLYLLCSLLCLYSLALHAQQFTAGTISGKIRDQKDQPIDGAVISLLDTASTIIRSALSGADGSFALERVPPGNYRIAVTAAGFDTYYQPVNYNQAQQLSLPAVTLTAPGKTLQGVAVTARKSFAERKADRTVVNADALIGAAAASAFELLEKSPGVLVDQNGNISMKGKPGVMIFIDDKPSYLSGSELESYLRSLPASAIDQLELMTNPPAKYDAQGNAGVINIRTKKGRAKDFNGGLNLSHAQGIYGRFNNSLNLNYRHNKLNLFANVSGSNINNYNDLDINRHFKYADGAPRAALLQNTLIRHTGWAGSAKLGADYYLSERSTVGVVLNGMLRNGHQDNRSTSRLLNAANDPDSTIIAANKQHSIFRNGSVNANYRHQFRKDGPELTADLDYLHYTTGNDQSFNNTTYLPGDVFKTADQLTGALPAQLDIYTAKTDYTHPLKNGTQLSAGLKYSYTHTDNLADYTYTTGGITQPDYDKSNHFLYNETIAAAYLNATREFKRLSVQLGLRMEHTISDGHQLGNLMKPDSSFRRQYTDFFPTAYLSYKLDSAGKHQAGLNYGRRINRPYYQDLNPFVSPLDKFTYYSGNPFLKPSYTDNVELSYTWNNMVTLGLNYGRVHDDADETVQIVNNIYYNQPGNVSTIIVKSLSIDGNFDLTKWLNFHIYTELTNLHSKGMVYGIPLNTQGTFWHVQPLLQLKLSKGWSAQLDGYYTTDRTSTQFVSLARGAMNLGLAKKLGDQLTIRAGVNDIFKTNRNPGLITNLANADADFLNRYDSRSVFLSVNWRFGKTIANQRRHDTHSADAERERVKG